MGQEFCDCKGGHHVTCDWKKTDPQKEVGRPGIPVNPLLHKNDPDEPGESHGKRSVRERRQTRVESGKNVPTSKLILRSCVRHNKI